MAPIVGTQAFGDSIQKPFEYGGNLYVLGADSVNNIMRMLRSTDGGTTWNELDSANAVDLSVAPYASISVALGWGACVDGTQLLIFIPSRTGLNAFGNIILKKFNLAAGLWGPATTPGSQPGVFTTQASGSPNRQTFVQPIRRGAGDFILVTYGPLELVFGVLRSRIRVVAFDGTNFGATFDVPNQAGNAKTYLCVGNAVDSTGRIHICYIDTLNAFLACTNYSVTFLPGNTFGTTKTINTNGFWQGVHGGWSFPINFVSSGEKVAWCGFVFDDPSHTTYSIRMWIATPADDDLWIEVIVENDQSLTPGGVFNFYDDQMMAMGFIGGILRVTFNTSVSNGGLVNAYYRSTSTDLATFTAPAQIFLDTGTFRPAQVQSTPNGDFLVSLDSVFPNPYLQVFALATGGPIAITFATGYTYIVTLPDVYGCDPCCKEIQIQETKMVYIPPREV